MLKGTQKKMIVVQGTNGSAFETVYFVLKKDAEDGCRYGEKDMIGEANRIIDENLADVTRRRLKKRSRKITAVLSFLSGLAVGIGAMMLLNFFI